MVCSKTGCSLVKAIEKQVFMKQKYLENYGKHSDDMTIRIVQSELNLLKGLLINEAWYRHDFREVEE